MNIFMRMKTMNNIENNELLFIKTNDDIIKVLQTLTTNIHSLLPHLAKIVTVTDKNQLIRARNIAKYDENMRNRLEFLVLNHSLDDLLFNINEMNKIANKIKKDE